MASPTSPLLNPSPKAPGLFSRVFSYFRGDLRADGVAGSTVAIMGIPQAMAYAMIAGVPPVYGLYTSILSCVLGALFGSSNHLVTGPTNATSWLIFSVVAAIPRGLLPVDFSREDQIIEAVLLLTLMTGAVKLVFGLLRLGVVVRYISNSVVVGLTAGAGILIAGNQLKNIMNLSLPAEKTAHFYEVILETFRNIHHTNPYDLGLGIGTALIVLFAKRIHRKMPGPLLGVILSAAVVYFMKWDAHGVSILRDLSEKPIQGVLNTFHFPRYLLPGGFNWGLVREMSGGAVAIAILGLVEASSSSRAVAASSGQKLNYSREFIGQGVGNIGGAFFLNFAGSGSFTRTALNYQSGGRTRMSAVFSALFTALVVVLLAPLAGFIPKASLAGMLIVIAYGMIEKNRFRLAMRSGFNSRAVLFATLLSTLIMPLQYAIFVGVFLSIVFLLKITGRADLTLLVPRENGRFEEIPYSQALGEPIVLINMAGDFYFAAVENLDSELNRALSSDTRVVILRMKRLRAAGSSAMAILAHYFDLLEKRGISLVVSGIDKSLSDLLSRSGLRDKIGEQNIFYADNTLFQSTELAVARARGVVEMERRRRELKSALTAPPPSVSIGAAREVMSRQCVRFGQGHSVREAVWLLSEMSKRLASRDVVPLFLQDVEGKLVGSVTAWDLLSEMTKSINLDEMCQKADEDLGARLISRFEVKLSSFANRQNPVVGMNSRLGRMIFEWAKSDAHILPIQDEQGRIAGMVGQSDLLDLVGGSLVSVEENSELTKPSDEMKQR